MVQKLSDRFGLDGVITAANLASNLPPSVITTSNISSYVSATPQSITPTLTGDSSWTIGFNYELTISNYASYSNAVFFWQMLNNAGIIVDSGSLSGDDLITIPKGIFDNSPHTINVYAMEPGKLTSSKATKSLGNAAYPSVRYIRLDNIIGETPTGSNGGVGEFRVYSGAGQSGTDLAPTSITASYQYSATYAPSRARDGNVNTMWWTLGSSAPQWLQYDFGSSVSIGSFRINPYGNGTSYTFNVGRIIGSNTGSFTGEEIVFYDDISTVGLGGPLDLG
jgi:hypothetical protein